MMARFSICSSSAILQEQNHEPDLHRHRHDLRPLRKSRDPRDPAGRSAGRGPQTALREQRLDELQRQVDKLLDVAGPAAQAEALAQAIAEEGYTVAA